MSARRALVVAAALGGVAYAVSPLTAWLVLAVWLLWRAAVNGVANGERRWMSCLVATGLVIRLLAIAALIVSTTPGSMNNPSFFGDGSYAIGRSLWLLSIWLGEPVHPRYFIEAFDEYGGGGHNYFQAAVQLMVGPSPLALHLLAVTIFLAGAVLMYRLVRRSYGPTAAVVAFAVIWLAPSWIAWSITPIKDGFQFLLVVITLACVTHARRGRGRLSRLAALACIVAAVAILSSLRSGGLFMMVVTVGAGVVWSVIARWRTAAVAALAVAMIAGLALGPTAMVRQRISDEVVDAVNRHLGHVRTQGTHFKLLDERLYHLPWEHRVVPEPLEGLRFVIRAATAFVTVPLPWDVKNSKGALYLPVQLLWYFGVAFAIGGLPAALRRDALLTTMLLAYIAISAAIIAPNSGNVGTLIRHRDSVTPFVACISGVGVSCFLARRRLAVPALEREYA